jgi:predicted Rossmann fold flavoprotein
VMMATDIDVVVIGAGAAGLMCASTAGKRGRRVLLVDHATKIAEKIRISGGGRCNFTNLYAAPETFLSANPHFCKSALRQYDQHDFIALVDRHKIAYHEKKLGQLFCDDSAQNIIDMLVLECQQAGVNLQMGRKINNVDKREDGFHITLNTGVVRAQSLVVATGGLSIPKIGATGFGYQLARQFGLQTLAQRPGLVPLTFDQDVLTRCKSLSGLSVEAEVGYRSSAFAEGLLFTHRGLSGPSILQISSYWQEAMPVSVNLAPQHDAVAHLLDGKTRQPKADVANCLADLLPKRLAVEICDLVGVVGRLADRSDKHLRHLGKMVNDWQLIPNGTEGYRTAEVTLGGVDTNGLSSKTMEAKTVSGLYFIGEVVDVTGHLGGYNFQWAWSSGFVAGQNA